ncbi:hypothetical protein [Paenibacillus wulumuqiensis]|uniref:hypothetical protein n=1 Tax=Paenibacillus wulumuqiensis TaxID=1567107 RepID=UPI00061962C9|nr:hypothetical protein [Paenibacillus wulumuqiensis]
MGKWIDYALGFCIVVINFRLYGSTGNMDYLWIGLTIGIFAVHLVFYKRKENDNEQEQSVGVKRKLQTDQKLLLTGVLLMMLNVGVVYIGEDYQLPTMLPWVVITIQSVFTLIASWHLLRTKSSVTR